MMMIHHHDDKSHSSHSYFPPNSSSFSLPGLNFNIDINPSEKTDIEILTFSYNGEVIAKIPYISSTEEQEIRIFLRKQIEKIVMDECFNGVFLCNMDKKTVLIISRIVLS